MPSRTSSNQTDLRRCAGDLGQADSENIRSKSPGLPEMSGSMRIVSFIEVTSVIRDGDVVNLLIESSAAGGYFYDLRRFLCIGNVPKELQEPYRSTSPCSMRTKSPSSVRAAHLFAIPGAGCPPMRRRGPYFGVDPYPLLSYDTAHAFSKRKSPEGSASPGGFSQTNGRRKR